MHPLGEVRIGAVRVPSGRTGRPVFPKTGLFRKKAFRGFAADVRKARSQGEGAGMTCFWKRGRKRISDTKAREEYPPTLVRDVYVAGLRILRLRRRGFVTTAEMGGLPLLRVERYPYKVRCCLAGMELFKVRMSGMQAGLAAEGPFFLDRSEPQKCRLFWNIGPLAFREETSGVARVARSLLYALRELRFPDYEICPVYTAGSCPGYVHARSYAQGAAGKGAALDTPVIFTKGDILLSPVPDVREVESHFHALKALQGMGVRVLFFVHDLIPLRHPEFCPVSFRENFARWLPLISQFDGVITVSAAVAEDYRAWRRENGWSGDFFVDWFHLGGDMEHVVPTSGIPERASAVLCAMKKRPTFLSVSTVERRKGYRQALLAMEKLWAEGQDVNFVIVGRKGWNVDELAERLERHPEHGRRLFWLRGISDACLDAVYAAADCVLFPSEAEGFGLAVAEGAMHGKPLILRDLPVFRETAGENALYFTGREPEDLALCLKRWLRSHAGGREPSPSAIRILSWRESAAMLLSRLAKLNGA